MSPKFFAKDFENVAQIESTRKLERVNNVPIPEGTYVLPHPPVNI